MTVVKPLAVAASASNPLAAGQPAGGAAPSPASVQGLGLGAGPADVHGAAAADAPRDQCAEGEPGNLGTQGTPGQAPTADVEWQERSRAADADAAGEVTAAPDQAQPGPADTDGRGVVLMGGPKPVPLCGAPPASSGNGVAPNQAQAVCRPPSNGAGPDAAAAVGDLRNQERREGAHAGDGQGCRADQPEQRSQAPDEAQASARERGAHDARAVPRSG